MIIRINKKFEGPVRRFLLFKKNLLAYHGSAGFRIIDTENLTPVFEIENSDFHTNFISNLENEIIQISDRKGNFYHYDNSFNQNNYLIAGFNNRYVLRYTIKKSYLNYYSLHCRKTDDVLWQVIAYYFNPFVSGNAIYYTSNPTIPRDHAFNSSILYRLDIETGKELWSSNAHDIPLELMEYRLDQILLVQDDTIWIASSEGFLLALDSNTGEFKFMVDKSFLADPTINHQPRFIKSNTHFVEESNCLISVQEHGFIVFNIDNLSVDIYPIDFPEDFTGLNITYSSVINDELISFYMRGESMHGIYNYRLKKLVWARKYENVESQEWKLNDFIVTENKLIYLEKYDYRHPYQGGNIVICDYSL